MECNTGLLDGCCPNDTPLVDHVNKRREWLMILRARGALILIMNKDALCLVGQTGVCR